MAGIDDAPYPYRRPPELGEGLNPRRPVVVVGAGPVGLAAAIDLATHGIATIVVDDDDRVSVGSRAICWAKRTLEIFDRLGIGDRMVAKGVTWKVGRTFHREREIAAIDLLPEPGHKMPAFINLQQPYVERYLIDRTRDFPELIELRWRSKVVGVGPGPDHVRLDIACPDGRYGLEAEWVVAADGARSAVRRLLGLALEGQAFEEKFLIADVRLEADRPNERHFWFRPRFDPGDSVLLHRQPDDVYRVDFQLGPDADSERELEPERVAARVRSVFGPDIAFTPDWSSVYSFRCARLARFVHGRVVFAGDSAHVVSPFGARGGNGGIQDVDNLCWKLALVLRGEAPEGLVASYDEERGLAADENIRHSARTSRFMTPKTRAERAFRDGVLALAAEFPFAARLVNGGRLSRPCHLAGSAALTPAGEEPGAMSSGASMSPGAACADAPVLDAEGRPAWLLGALGGGFTALVFAGQDGDLPKVGANIPPGIRPLVVAGRAPARRDLPHVVDPDGTAHRRYGAGPGTTILVRPDQHVAAHLPALDRDALAAAHRRALGWEAA